MKSRGLYGWTLRSVSENRLLVAQEEPLPTPIESSGTD